MRGASGGMALTPSFCLHDPTPIPLAALGVSSTEQPRGRLSATLIFLALPRQSWELSPT